MSETDVPKLFISYSWSNPDHEKWVLALATELRELGVDAILDKWHLKEGQDSFAFMERMVNDATIKKVIMICDETYVAKANGRSAGVGTETQIITAEIYGSQDQEKFVAIIRDRDESGKPLVPTYFHSRVYIDMSDASTYAEAFDKLIRWIYGKPLYQLPELGAKPTYLSGTSQAVHLATSASHRRAIESVRGGRDYAIPALTEYLALLSSELEKFRISDNSASSDDSFIRSIVEFVPYRDELISLFTAVAIYRPSDEAISTFHKLFEAMIRYMERPPQVNNWGDTDFDNFKFMAHELFLYVVAVFIMHERFEVLGRFLQKEYYVGDLADYRQNPLMPFTIFSPHIKTLAIRNERLKLNRLSLQADLIKERCKGTGVEFDKLMTADFILFLRGKLIVSDDWRRWWPDTLIFVGRFAHHFEVFTRSKSASYFDRFKVVIGVKSKVELNQLLIAMEAQEYGVPRWQFESFNPRILAGFSAIATTP